MQWASKIYIFLAFIFGVSCIQDYEIDFDHIEKRLSVLSEMDPNDTLKVLVALPKKPNQYGNFTTPKDAKVIIKEDGVFWDELDFSSKDSLGMYGVYISDKKVNHDKYYEIEVTYQDYPKVSASQKVPKPISIEKVKYHIESDEIFNQDEIFTQIKFLQNYEGEKYYALIHFMVLKYSVLDQYGELHQLEHGIYMNQKDNYGGFRDQRGYKIIKTQDDQEIQFQLIYDLRDWTDTTNIHSIELFTFLEEISADSYLYKSSLRNRNDDYYGELYRVYGNIQNGYGVFLSKVSHFIAERIY